MIHDVAYIFDIDGTLTPSRQMIDPEFRQKFMKFQMENATYLVTGSDFDKTLNQVGYQIIFSAEKTFHCCGNEGRHKGKVFYRNEWTPSTEVIEYLNELLTRSKFPRKQVIGYAWLKSCDKSFLNWRFKLAAKQVLI